MAINPDLMDIINIAIILIAAFLIIKIVDYFLKKTGKQLDLEITVIQVLQEIVKYTVIAIAVVMVLNQLEVNVSGLILSLGILGIAVGFAARDTLSNFISGIFVLSDKSFKVGDVIEVSDQIGTVTKMGFRVTTMVTIDNKVVTIPNTFFSTDPYINYTTLDKRRVELPVTIPYELETEDVIKSMEKKASSLNWVLNDPKPEIIITEFSDLGIKASLNVWIDDPWKVNTYRSSLAREIKGLLVYKNA